MRNKIMTALMAAGMIVSVANATVVSKNGIAKDSATGLMWQDDANVATVQKDWEEAKQYCSELRLGGYKDWRLPNIYELITLLDNAKANGPYIVDGFENFNTSSYWSSTTCMESADYAWAAHASGGFDTNNDKSNIEYVRCVRGKELKFDNLILLKKHGKLNVGKYQIDIISPEAEAKRKKEIEKQAERKRQKRQNKSSSSNIEYVSWTPGYKYNQSDSYPPFSYQTTEIICSNGTKGTVFDYYNRTGGDRFIINGNHAVNSFNEGADYICGNK